MNLSSLDQYSLIPDAKIDLHLHTSASDGTWEPEELMEQLLMSGIGLFALTDHDTTENIEQAAELAQKNRLRFIPGVEVNTSCQQRNYHILGLGICPEDRSLQELLRQNRDFLEKKDEGSILYLENIYPQVSLKEYRNFVHSREKGGWKALQYLMAKGICQDEKQFFTLFEGIESPFKQLSYPAPAEAVQIIKQAGGKAILAHPGSRSYGGDYQAVVALMLTAGIDGFECFHPDNSPAVTDYCLKICREQHLLITGGSDCHGTFVSSRCIGRPDVRFSQLNLEGIKAL